MILASMLVQPLAGMSVYADEPVTTAETSASEIQDDTSYTLNSLDDMANLMVSLTYADYLADYANVPDTTKEIDIDVTKYNNDLSEGEIEVNEKDTVVRDGKEIVAGTVSTTDEGKLVYDIDVPETAMYSVTVEYYPIAGNGSTIERILLIDDKIPFNEARYMNFTRVWIDKEESGYSRAERTFKLDINQNEMRPVKEEAPEWRTQTLIDSQAFYDEPFKFYLTEGKHTFAFESASEPLKIASIKLHKAETLPTYEEYLSLHKDAPSKRRHRDTDQCGNTA